MCYRNKTSMYTHILETERGRNAEGEFGTDCMHEHALAHVPTPKP